MTPNASNSVHLSDRLRLLKSFDRIRSDLGTKGTFDGLDSLQRQSLEILTSNKMLEALDLSKEPLVDPDSLAGVVDEEGEVEAEVYPGADAWFLKTGTEQNEGGYAAFNRAVKRKYPDPGSPKGKQWDFDDDAQVRRRLPRLAKVFLGDDEDD